MSLFEGFWTMRLVEVGPSLRERLERWLAGQHQRTVVAHLRRLRQGLEEDMGPEELWTALRAPAVLLLSDVCDALGLAEMEKAAVLGPEGERALAEAMETGMSFNAATPGERQARALKAAERRGHVNLALYRELCPFWSDETLRLDLVELVERGLLAKNGRTKGTFYTVVKS